MKRRLYLFAIFYSLQLLVSCLYSSNPNTDDRWPIIYSSTENTPIANADISTIDKRIFIKNRETPLIPISRKSYTLPNTSPEYMEGIFRSRLCKTSNCKPSYDKWDCDDCKNLIPDGVIVRSFNTFPRGTAGFILVSESQKTIHVLLRGASTVRTRSHFGDNVLVPHPFIPEALVRRGLLESLEDISNIVYTTVHDQLRLHPDYKVEVTGHSYGAALGSLLVVDMFHRMPEVNSTNLIGYLLGKPRIGTYEYAKYIADNNLRIIRFVEGIDEANHYPFIEDGYVHEGDEYWHTNDKLLVCPGPFESRNCSNSLDQLNVEDHFISFSIHQECLSNFYNGIIGI